MIYHLKGQMHGYIGTMTKGTDPSLHVPAYEAIEVDK